MVNHPHNVDNPYYVQDREEVDSTIVEAEPQSLYEKARTLYDGIIAKQEQEGLWRENQLVYVNEQIDAVVDHIFEEVGGNVFQFEQIRGILRDLLISHILQTKDDLKELV